MFVPLGWLFSLAVSLHNLEETLGFPHYAQHFRPWHIRPFLFALVVLTALAFIMTFLSQAGGERSVGA